MTRRPFAALLAVYAALTLAITWPLVLHLGSTVPNDLGDPLLSTSILWWNAHVLPLTERWWKGFAFFPFGGTLALSDHRLGESLLASPLQWLGCSPVTAYNLTLLATFPLSAIAAHALAFTLTRRHDASAICGLAFGFNPFRFAHISHLELLAGFGMPAALAALHQYLANRRRRWLLLFSAALAVQGLCTSYYLAFFSIVLVLWTVWYIRWQEWRVLAGLAAAAACAAAMLLPLAIAYARIHRAYGLSRGFGEVLTFSGDITSVVTAPDLSALWRWTAGLNAGERQLFPGLTIVLLAVVGLASTVRGSRVGRDWGNAVCALSWAASCAYVAVAFGTIWLGPWRVAIGPLTLQADVLFKPMSVALALFVLGLAVRPRTRRAWRGRSDFAFYLFSSAFLFLCSFGPKPAFHGRQVLYEPPYAWLMRLPVFSTEIRAPARLQMPAALMLAVAAALGFHRLRLTPSRRRLAAVVLIAGVLADGWIRALPLPQVPAMWSSRRADGFDAVVELPIGAGFLDSEAMYRATLHGRPVVNGISGYFPPHYLALQQAVEEGEADAIDVAARMGRLLFVVDGTADPDHRWSAMVEAHPGATPLGTEGRWSFFAVTPRPLAPVCGHGEVLPIHGASFNGAAMNVSPIVDGSAATIWATSWPQRAGDTIVLDLESTAQPCAVLMSLGPAVYLYPRKLEIDTSADGAAWTPAFAGSALDAAVRAALARPADPWLEFALPGLPTRFIRLRLAASHPKLPWLITDLAIRGRPGR